MSSNNFPNITDPQLGKVDKIKRKVTIYFVTRFNSTRGYDSFKAHSHGVIANATKLFLM